MEQNITILHATHPDGLLLLLNTAPTITTTKIRMRITSTPEIAIAAIAPPLSIEEPPGVGRPCNKGVRH